VAVSSDSKNSSRRSATFLRPDVDG
jgi:hypothetical protein